MAGSAERVLQREIMLRLTAGPWPVIPAPIPNGIYLPAHDEDERRIVGRLMKRLKDDGMLLPGAADLVVLGRAAGLYLELKRPTERDLFGRKTVRGQLSAGQKEFRRRCERAGVPYEVAYTWDGALAALRRHGVIEGP
jgi:hypothetical protein